MLTRRRAEWAANVERAIAAPVVAARNRRGEDGVLPYADIPIDQLTPEQRIELQGLFVKRWEARAARRAWARMFYRTASSPKFIRRRIDRPRSGSQRGSPAWRLARGEM